MLINRLPFFFSATKKNDNGGFPKVFPFKAVFDNQLGLYCQVDSTALTSLLEKVYRRGYMLTGGFDDPLVGDKRLKEAIDFLKNNYKFSKKLRVLEIGCGDGRLLKEVAKSGAECIGIEPAVDAKEIVGKNIRIINDFFPSKKVTGKFDLILHFTVLEHIQDPVKFMQLQKKLLKKNGTIICSFPNCEPYLTSGDISLFLHEHFNYFSRHSIVKVVSLADLFLEKTLESIDGSMFFAKIALSPRVNRKLPKYPVYSSKDFEKKVGNLNIKLTNFFKRVKQSDIAVYCPTRAMNWCYLSGFTSCRLVDDNTDIRGCYLPGFKNRIENFKQLVKNPPKKIFVYSHTFGELIKKKCQKAKELQHTEIKSIKDYYD